MAMTKCPECKNDVSDKAIACPHCGFGVKDYFDEKKRQDTQELQDTYHQIKIQYESMQPESENIDLVEPQKPKRPKIPVISSGIIGLTIGILLQVSIYFIVKLILILALTYIWVDKFMTPYLKKWDEYKISMNLYEKAKIDYENKVYIEHQKNILEDKLKKLKSTLNENEKESDEIIE